MCVCLYVCEREKERYNNVRVWERERNKGMIMCVWERKVSYSVCVCEREIKISKCIGYNIIIHYILASFIELQCTCNRTGKWESERLQICVLRILILPTNFCIRFWNCYDSVVCDMFCFLIHYRMKTEIHNRRS